MRPTLDLLVLLVLLAGCTPGPQWTDPSVDLQPGGGPGTDPFGGGGDGPEEHPHGVTHPDFVYAPELMLPETDPCFAHAIPNEERTELELWFECAPEYAPEAGMLLAGVRSGGYLVWVDAVEWDGLDAVAETTPASLGDAILEGELDVDLLLPSQERSTLDFSGAELVLEAENGHHILRVPTATLDITPRLKANATFDGLQPTNAHLLMGITATASLRLEAEIPITRVMGERTLGVVERPFLFMAGALPVAGTVKLDIKLRGEIDLAGPLELETGFDVQAEGGFDAVWSQDAGPDLQAGYGFLATAAPTTVDIAAEGFVKVGLKPGAKLLLYGIAGPKVSTHFYVKAAAEVGTDAVDWTIRGGVKAYGGVGFDFLGIPSYVTMDPWIHERDLIAGQIDLP
ncbi:MAG: hypothetical protein GY898_09000 [Proteobacteria bacterium]|nr:hypothetical protein [Pseudomonadota bacterium]